jgi:hypothetical protein
VANAITNFAKRGFCVGANREFVIGIKQLSVIKPFASTFQKQIVHKRVYNNSVFKGYAHILSAYPSNLGFYLNRNMMKRGF